MVKPKPDSKKATTKKTAVIFCIVFIDYHKDTKKN
jgi:hypothetical protein